MVGQLQSKRPANIDDKTTSSVTSMSAGQMMDDLEEKNHINVEKDKVRRRNEHMRPRQL